jgi:signal transduction histidine kinase
LLGASVAHEIRNPLVAIRSFVEMLPAQHDNPAFREKFFRLIGDEVQRVDQLTRQLLELASPRLYSATSLELHPVLVSALTLIEAKAVGRGVKLHTDLAASPDRVCSDAAAIKQVVLNLCFNAIEAMERTAANERILSITTRTVPDGVELVVADSGAGIAPEIASRLFEPFQTTKSTGFGLGLSICREILANLGAAISADPHKPGAGATFRVVFPVP